LNDEYSATVHANNYYLIITSQKLRPEANSRRTATVSKVVIKRAAIEIAGMDNDGPTKMQG